uniref:Uncharacterized protein n=1 Tax=Arundo donax TaxID=35708 RepID=A0A0A9HPD7_ARUDO
MWSKKLASSKTSSWNVLHCNTSVGSTTTAVCRSSISYCCLVETDSRDGIIVLPVDFLVAKS